ncbi:MAG TPA: hypothetical protein VLQ78_04085, partial [Ornithinibacter sp.]|nr:hypothetical protein [Ornithinibacter sp.]
DRVPVTLPRGEPADDPVLGALADTLRAATPVQRAVVAGHAGWGAEPEEMAALLGMPPADVRAAADALRGRLGAAHDRAREAVGLGPAGWALDRDLDDAVTAVLRDQGDPPDPAALVAARTRRVRRRSVVVAGLATTGVAAALWAVGRGATSGTSAARPTEPATPPPGDPSWASTSTWAPRGALGSDDGVRALVIARTPPGSRLLWADEVGDRRIVVARLAESREGATTLAVWSGPRGAEPALLEEVPLTVREVTGTDSSAAVVVPDGSGATGLLVLLTSPRLLRCSHSATVVFTSAGGTRRRWTEVGLVDGVGTSLVPGPPGPALRVRLGRLEGAPAGTQQVTLGYGTGGDVATSLLSAVGPFALAATGPPRPGFTNEVVFDAPAPGDVIDPGAIVAQPREGRVAVVHTTTPEGALLRSVRVRDDGRSRAPYLDLEVLHPITAEDADRPFATPLPAVREEVGRFLVIAPGAAQAQLLAVTPNAYPASKVGDLRGGVGILDVVNSRQAAIYRLVLWDGDGTRVGSWRQRFGRRDPDDLWPRFTT